MALDLRTDKEKERDAVHDKIIGQFLALKKEAPMASNNRLMLVLAKEYGLSTGGINRILKSKQII